MCIVTATQGLLAQRTAYYFEPENLFNQGKEMFLEKNYTGAHNLLSEFLDKSDDALLKEEAQYMIAVSSFERGEEQSGIQMKEFLDDYPESVNRNHVNFLIGSYYFNKKDWKLADFWFSHADLDFLSPQQQEDYSFRNAFTNLQLGKKDESRRLFGLLSRNSEKYKDPANFYLGYIEYSDGEYDAAMTRFDRLRNHPQFREEVAFYTAQSTFLKGQTEQAIRLAEVFTNTYPQSQHTAEIYRILGNSNYRLGRSSAAIPFYENYLARTDTPLRGDAYFMGLSYFETTNYNQAVKMFQQAAGPRDPLNQNAQLYLGHSYLKLGQKEAAQMAFEAATRDNFDPQVRETAMFNYALLAHETNFSVFSESISLFENFLREFPNSQYSNQVNDILAQTFLTTKDYNAALTSINRISNPARRILEAKQMVIFQLGAQEFINGDMNEAIRFFNNSIAVGNYDAKARNNANFWRGEAYYRIGNFSAAATDFQQFTQQASASDENYSIAWYNLGYARFKQQQYNQAVNAFQQYIASETNRKKPEYSDALNRIGDSYYYNRNFAQAQQYYSQAADTDPSTADYAAYQKAFVMGLQRDYTGKINALDDLMRRFPNSQYFDDALYEKSRALTMLNRENDAITVLRTLVSNYSDSQLAAQGGVQLGQLYYNIGEFQQSINAYKNVISKFPGSDDARNALVSLETVYRDMNEIGSYVDYANSLPGGMRISPSRQDSLTYLAAEGVYMRGSREQAEGSLTRYLQSYPNGAYSSDAHYYLGVISDEKKNTSQALLHYRKVIDANSMKYLENALMYAAKAEYDSGDYRMALADYSRLANTARSAVNQQTGYLGMLRTHNKLQNHHEAIRAATALLATANLSPETITEARYMRGKAYQQVNEVENAMADYQFIAADTRNIYGAEAQFIIADTYLKWKSYAKAEAQVKDFMKKGTPHQYWMARALIVLSDTYLEQGDKFQARQYLESLRSNYKGNESDIKQMITDRLNKIN